jgi:hypothetical protein
MVRQRQRAAWPWGWVLALVALALGSAGTAEAGSYTFTLIADTSGAFTHLHSPPAINALGTVVFTADLAAGGRSVFTGSGGALTTIAESGGPLLSIGGNTINASGTVVVGAELSLDVVKGSTDKLLSGTRAVPILGAGDASSGSAVVTILSNTPLGTYILLACADAAGGSAEGDESNNCKASLGFVRVQ